MDNNLPNQPNPNQPSPQPTIGKAYSEPKIEIPTIQPEAPKNNKNSFLQNFALFKVGIMQLLLVVVALFFILAVLNYFNILPISKTFPNIFGFLPHKSSKQLSRIPVRPPNNTAITPTILPAYDLTQQGKQLLLDFLQTSLSYPLLPPSSSTITFKQNEGIKESFSANWDTKEGTASAIMVSSTTGAEISQMYLSFLKPQNQVPTENLAQITTSEFFKLLPKGKWGCQPIYENTMTFCENFWEEEGGARLGVGIIGSSNQESHLVFLCLHNKDSKLYSWKSCQNEFAETGVN